MQTLPTKPIITRRQTKMADWLIYCPIVLDELLRKDGLGDLSTPGNCANCMELVGEYRCNDCPGGDLYCSGCIVDFHRQRQLPLHRLEVHPGN